MTAETLAPKASPMARLDGQDRSLQVRLLFRVVTVALGALHAWIASTQQSMNADGISYLEMGDAYFRGDWSMAINSVWSPLYAWILGAATTLLRPEPASEFALVHTINFGCFLFAFFCFEYFWGRLRMLRPPSSSPTTIPLTEWPDWAWWAIGYTLFLWAALALVAIWAVTPDMLTAGFVLVAAATLIRIATGERSRAVFGAFGLILGLGYLAKSVMFPLSFVFLAAAWLVAGRDRRAAGRVAVALLAFLLVAGPYVAMLSSAKGRPTFGDAGGLAYLRYVNGVTYPHWREGVGAAAGVPDHPPRRVFDSPAAFEFASPIGGAYPLSYDPSYWYEGLSARFVPRLQLARLLESLRFYLGLFTGVQAAIGAVVAVLLLVGSATVRGDRSTAEWVVVGVALAALALYSLVYVEERYLAPFILMLWGGLLARVRLPAADWSRSLLTASAAGILLFLALALGNFHLEGFVKVAGLEPPSDVPVREEPPRYRPVQLAAELANMGVRPGDEIVHVGDSFHAIFARVARLRIIAEIPEIEQGELWHLDPERAADLLSALRATGASVIVAETGPSGPPPPGWERIGDSRHLLYRFR